MEFINVLEKEAQAQLAAVRSFREGKGDLKAARIAIGVIGAYVRLRATMANERSNQLIAYRLALEPLPVPRRVGTRRTTLEDLPSAHVAAASEGQ
jgi:hypothetical protein